jgi:tRNA G10  N-methylase Trm11
MNGTLSENAPLILDSTCSYPRTDVRASRWPAFASIRMDRRKEVGPDIVADARFLPFRNCVFDKIYCDPPHMIGNPETIERMNRHRLSTGRLSIGSWERYTVWSSIQDWYQFLWFVDLEFARTLKDSGTLEFKVTDGDSNGLTKTRDLERLQSFTELKRVMKSKSAFGNRVHFLTFTKRL